MTFPWVLSLELAGLQKAAALRPEWRRGLLNSMSVGDLSTLDLDFLALNGRAATLRTIRRAHRRGMQVYVWTVNDPLQMSVILSRGADGLITDVPAVAREVIAHRSQLGPAGRFLLWVAGESEFLRVNFAPSPTGDA